MLKADELQVQGLDAVSFSLNGGECIAIRGPSGSGKSLLLRAIADLDPNEGRVFLDTAERGAMSGPLWRRQVGYVPADPGWWDDRVGDHFADWNAAIPLLTRLGLGAEAKDWPISRLSTGERMRFALVRALLVKPKVLLLDEPTAPLDAKLAGSFETLIAEELRKGLSVLWVTHDAAQAARVSSRCLVLDNGRVREMAPS